MVIQRKHSYAVVSSLLSFAFPPFPVPLTDEYMNALCFEEDEDGLTEEHKKEIEDGRFSGELCDGAVKARWVDGWVGGGFDGRVSSRRGTLILYLSFRRIDLGTLSGTGKALGPFPPLDHHETAVSLSGRTEL